MRRLSRMARTRSVFITQQRQGQSEEFRIRYPCTSAAVTFRTSDLSTVFTVTVIANFVAMAQGDGTPPPWVTYSPLLPLAMLLFTGLYLFVLPYATKWRGRRT